jgi:hypothetical protein
MVNQTGMHQTALFTYSILVEQLLCDMVLPENCIYRLNLSQMPLIDRPLTLFSSTTNDGLDHAMDFLLNYWLEPCNVAT